MWRQRVDKQEEIQLEQIKQLEWTKQMYERVKTGFEKSEQDQIKKEILSTQENVEK